MKHGLAYSVYAFWWRLRVTVFRLLYFCLAVSCLHLLLQVQVRVQVQRQLRRLPPLQLEVTATDRKLGPELRLGRVL